VTRLAAGTKYCLRVSAKNSVGYGSTSEVIQVVTYGNAPEAPTALRVSSITKSSIALGWAAPTVVDGSKVRNYVVAYSTDQGTTWTTVRKSVSTSTKLTVNGLRAATTYWFKVTAINDVGESEAQQNPLVVVTK
jgi:predicted phage tail protein